MHVRILRQYREHTQRKSFDKSNHSHCAVAASGKRVRSNEEKRRARLHRLGNEFEKERQTQGKSWVKREAKK